MLLSYFCFLNKMTLNPSSQLNDEQEPIEVLHEQNFHTISELRRFVQQRENRLQCMQASVRNM